MSTVNAVGLTLKSYSGSGTFVGSNSPTLVTPTFLGATATSLAFNPTTDGIYGSTAGDAAGTGYVGEFITSTVSALSLSSQTATNITSISLSAGDWDVYGNVSFTGTASIVDALSAWISLTSATFPATDFSGPTYSGGGPLFSYNLPPGFSVPMQRVSISTTTTVYLSCYTVFISGTASASGILSARRRR